MTSQALREARTYEEAAEKRIAGKDRPGFHLSVRTGWMNDPNGFSFYNGKYHMFYQYYPYACKWGPMHWGHAVSDDLLHWAYLPAALAPDEAYDRDGCFSGSAISLEDDRHLLMYTGVDYEKYAHNPVLTKRDLPEGCSERDFRDPKIWKKPDGIYRCVAGNLDADKSGQILLFASEDGFSWHFVKVLAANRGRFGKMWECPDFFMLDGKGVLLTSPQDMLPQGFEYHNGNGTLCLIGAYDDNADEFTEERDQAIDYGIDFYAPQTILTPDGRLKLRIILDLYSVEVFINDGEQVMTAITYTDPSADGISFFADGKARMDVIKYNLVEGEQG